jgi:hypothetical protein
MEQRFHYRMLKIKEILENKNHIRWLQKILKKSPKLLGEVSDSNHVAVGIW